MQTYFGFHHSNLPFKECALTIGNFDGVHKGHLQIFKKLRDEANKRKLPTVIITFEPLASEYFAKIKHNKCMPYRITPLYDKLSLIAQSKYIDYVFVIRFNHFFSMISAEQFIKNILIDWLNTRYLLIGDDFRFGKDRQGDYQLLTQETHFITQRTPSVIINDIRASSSAVRSALLNSDFKYATAILGHDYFLTGKVKHGLKLGRKLASPTANINLNHHLFPLSGVYVTEVSGDFGIKRGVANFGFNPTVKNDKIPKLEVHIFDLDEDLYGKKITVIFKHKIRAEKKFNNLAELKQQIALDMDYALSWEDE